MKDQWNDIKEAHPRIETDFGEFWESVPVLASDKSGKMRVARLQVWQGTDTCPQFVTCGQEQEDFPSAQHWMHLPQAPK